MDVVPKNQRGRWNAAETINGAMWAGSALFGGYLIDKYGFVQNFLITAIMQVRFLYTMSSHLSSIVNTSYSGI